MADILIRMEMPTHCIDCPCMVDKYGGDNCCLQSEEANAKIESWDDMKSGCPLLELPPNGNLIERVQTLRAINNCDIPDGVSEHDFYEVIASVHEAMEKVPVIVPSNKEKTE